MQFPGLRLLAIGVAILLVALASLTAPLPAGALLAGAAVLLVGAVWMDGRARDRLMRRDAFRPVSVVLAVAWSCSAVVVANIRSKETRKTLTRLGPAMIGTGLLLVLTGLEIDQVALVVMGQLVIGSGFGICNGYLNLTMMEAASDAERDRTSALMPTTQSAGNAIGAALAGVAANSAGMAAAASAGAVKAAILPVYGLSAVMAVLAFAAAWRMVKMIKPQDANSSSAAG